MGNFKLLIKIQYLTRDWLEQKKHKDLGLEWPHQYDYKLQEYLLINIMILKNIAIILLNLYDLKNFLTGLIYFILKQKSSLISDLQRS